MNETLWDRFFRSGSVSDYLAYAKKRAEVKSGADENCRNDFEAT